MQSEKKSDATKHKRYRHIFIWELHQTHVKHRQMSASFNRSHSHHLQRVYSMNIGISFAGWLVNSIRFDWFFLLRHYQTLYHVDIFISLSSGMCAWFVCESYDTWNWTNDAIALNICRIQFGWLFLFTLPGCCSLTSDTPIGIQSQQQLTPLGLS